MDARNRVRLRWTRKRQGEMRKVVRRTVIRESRRGDGPRGSQRIEGSLRIQQPTESTRRHPVYPLNRFRTSSSGRTSRGAGNNRGRPNRGSQEFFCWKGMQDYIARSSLLLSTSYHYAALTPRTGSSHYFLPPIRPENSSSCPPSHPRLALSSGQRPSPRSTQSYRSNVLPDPLPFPDR